MPVTDDEPFVKRLHRDLVKEGIQVWWDRKAMESRGRSFLQEIRDAIEGIDRLIAVIGPKAVESDYVRYEWEYALLFAKSIVPLLRLGTYDLLPDDLQPEADQGLAAAGLGILHSPDFRDDVAYQASLTELVEILRKGVPELGSVDGTPALPPHFLPRREDILRLQSTVLADVQKPTVITSAEQTSALQGMGGIGKSVLAAALARTLATRHAFEHGIVWLTVGENATRRTLLDNIKHVGLAFGDDRAHYVDEAAAYARLPEILADKMCLLILDDVWSMDQIDPFRNALGPRCRQLVTTRDGGLVTGLGAEEHRVNLLSDEQAQALLTEWSGEAHKPSEAEARSVARECGNLPGALALCGAMARDEMLWSDMVSELKKANLRFIEQTLPNYPYKNVFRALKVSVDQLAREDSDDSKHYLEHYQELAIFPPDRAVPEAAILTLWSHTNALPPSYARKLLTILDKRGLVRMTGTAPARLISMHDLQHDYLLATTPDIAAYHRRLLDAYRAACTDDWASGPDDGYYFQQLPYHLAEAKQWEDLVAFMLDPGILDKRLDDPYGINASFDLALRAIISDEPLAAVPLAFKLALGWQAFRRGRLYATRLFEPVRQGKLGEFERRLSLYAVDQEWRAAARLTAAWLAPDSVRSEADKLRLENRTGTTLDERVDAFFNNREAKFQTIEDCVGEWEIEHIFMQYGMMDAEQRDSARFDPDREENRNLVATIAPKLVGFAQTDSQQGTQKFIEYLRLIATNEYREYRNESLWEILCAAVRHRKACWVRDRLESIISAACSGGGRAFSGAVHAAFANVTDRTELRVAIEQAVDEARNVAQKQSREPGKSDTWSELLRTFCALAEVKAVLIGDDATDLIHDALACHSGYAGFRAPACLTLVESIDICGANSALKDQALDEARNAAQNVLNPAFCTRMLSRVSALHWEWWKRAPMSGSDLTTCIKEFDKDPGAVAFTARDRFDERQEWLQERQNDPEIESIRQRSTLAELVDVYNVSLSDLVTANPDVSPDADLSGGPTVRVPDPLFTPMLAAFFSAKVLSCPDFSREKRVELILKLVPPACTNPTTLDTVLGRLLLALRQDVAAHPVGLERSLDEIARAVRDYAAPATTAASG